MCTVWPPIYIYKRITIIYNSASTRCCSFIHAVMVTEYSVYLISVKSNAVELQHEGEEAGFPVWLSSLSVLLLVQSAVVFSAV